MCLDDGYPVSNGLIISSGKETDDRNFVLAGAFEISVFLHNFHILFPRVASLLIGPCNLFGLANRAMQKEVDFLR